ncbi:TetR/AcrR family transcriptional regulator [[Mycobacterium] vasticus]|uniref:TetR/AcrR family transcriptional regulator C-terminal ligand-binding domain-containing protein n=1 Tax=[Mycobacterium] vasticus TaxID=2875777 RepID=A0ABU5YZT4_9MYCO|nr:TetR/AcrR family transcriptional regulator C-terminal ligand-binding domain-containing protein [Mycolicibacter sp. MYC017]MEB3070658.1 TetR/AcrR family transcriptional regulator C-terminal ligand-binding domain-containing protein [Mycolicibacter sp. MYC017]
MSASGVGGDAAVGDDLPPRKSAAGRRRDPTIDDRLRRTARALYAREGWAGFHFDGVAKAAGVSKDAVYRRYSDAQSLLIDALSDQVVPALADDRPVEEALVAFACDTFTYFASGDGNANLRVHVDAVQYPNVLQQYRTRVVEPQLAQAVSVLERAREQGRLGPDVSCRAVVEALGGAVIVHALASAPWLSATGDCEVLDSATVRLLSEFVQQILYGRIRPSATRRRRPPAAVR